MEMAFGECSNKGGEVGPAHREMDGKYLAEDLIELGLNESNESGQHVLLHRRLLLEAGIDFLCGFDEHRKFEHCWVAFLRTDQDHHHDKPLL